MKDKDSKLLEEAYSQIDEGDLLKIDPKVVWKIYDYLSKEVGEGFTRRFPKRSNFYFEIEKIF